MPKPGTAIPLGRLVSRLKAESRIGTARAPELGEGARQFLCMKFDLIDEKRDPRTGPQEKEAFRALSLISPPKKVSPLSTAVTTATAGLNSIGSIL